MWRGRGLCCLMLGLVGVWVGWQVPEAGAGVQMAGHGVGGPCCAGEAASGGGALG